MSIGLRSVMMVLAWAAGLVLWSGPLAAAPVRGVVCETYLAHLTAGDAAWEDILEVRNTGDTAASFTLALYAGGQTVYEQEHQVGALSLVSLRLKDLAATATCGKLTACTAGVGARLAYEQTGGGGVAAFDLASAVPRNALAFVFANFASFVDWKGIALMNTGASQAAVTLKAFGGGVELGQAALNLAARSRTVGVIADFFPRLSPGQVERIEASGPASLVGLSISGSYASPRLLFSPALAMDGTGCERFIAHLTGGDPVWSDVLEVDNTSGAAASFTLTLYNQGAQIFSQSFSVPARESLSYNLNDLAPSATCGLIAGCPPALHYRMAFEQENGGVAGFDLSEAQGRAELALPFDAVDGFADWKGLALMNTADAPHQATLYAVGGGDILGSHQLMVPARGRVVGTLADFFPLLPLSQVELIAAVADSPALSGIVISGNTASPKLLFAAGSPLDGFNAPPVQSADLVVLAWNDLGMHCLNPTYDQAVILPPYNTIWAQVVEPGNPPRVVTQDLVVEYSILDNTFSYGKRSFGQFWDFDQALFGVDLAVNTGLNLVEPDIHNGLSGIMRPAGDHFQVDGIPVTPVSDQGVWNPYQVAQITVKNMAGQTLAQTRAMVPTSEEIHCDSCHGQNAFADVLAVHPLVDGQSLTAQKPVLCASCHGSPALGQPAGERGSSGKYLSEAIHGFHADKDAVCYDCHPGQTTKCSRSLRHTTADGNCVTCHGSMAQVASSAASGSRVPWLDEPGCVDCHEGVPGVDTGATLYRNARGHGGLSCPACHQSPHAMVPSSQAADNYQATQYMQAAVSMGSCAACHQSSKGPGDMDEFGEEHGGSNPEEKNACHVCHTVVSASNTADWPHGFGWQAR
jgi:hypothetical protein